MEVKFVASASAIQEAVWLCRFLNHLVLTPKHHEGVVIYSDSQVAIAYTKNPKYRSKTKHIDIKYNFVRDMIAHKVVITYVPIHQMVTNPFRKPILHDVYNT